MCKIWMIGFALCFSENTLLYDVIKYFALFIIHVSEMFCFAQNVKNVESMPVI